MAFDHSVSESAAVVIRSVCVARDGQAELGVGSDVVVDSNSDAEYDECLLKSRFLSGLAD
jgi:para-aminobenzoate synthetase/4-amino-4-deoxychorismate lyase